MKNTDFVKKAKEIYNTYETKYQLGTFMNKISNGKLLTDCSGFIKGILWGYPKKGKYQSNNVPDINANTMINKCSGVSTNFKNIEVGEIVWVKGHVGIYIGDGKVLESTSKWQSKLQITALGNKGTIKGLNTRYWAKHGKLPYISYSAYYVVKKGDTLSSIAKEHNTTANRLAAVNNIRNKNLIFEGQKLVIK
jgi:nucleoid-associated protein YgaU